MRHAGGALSEVHLDFVQPTYSRGCKVVCRTGAVEWRFRENRVLVSDHERRDWTVAHELGEFDFNRTYIDELRHFIRCVEGGEAPINDLAQGINVLRLGLAALESSTRRAFVPIAT
jgi:predicted dehydrogenase